MGTINQISGRLVRARSIFLCLIVAGSTMLVLVREHAADANITAAHKAGTMAINDKAYLSVTGGAGNTLIEEGSANGTLPGKTIVSLDMNNTTATSKFTLYPSGGSITGNGTVRLSVRSNTSTRYLSFSGSVSVGHGTGRYAHAYGTGNIYGVLDRRHDSAEVEVIGTLHN